LPPFIGRKAVVQGIVARNHSLAPIANDDGLATLASEDVSRKMEFCYESKTFHEENV